MAEETKAKEEAKPKAETKPKETRKKAIQKPANCMKCNKRLQRKAWYYRNGGYYCSKRCWELASAKNKES